MLTFDRGERLNVGQIVEVSTLSCSAISHYLKILHDADILLSEKVGKEVYFWVNRAVLDDRLQNVLDYVRKHT